MSENPYEPPQGIEEPVPKQDPTPWDRGNYLAIALAILAGILLIWSLWPRR
jgi:hypothetical protein